MVMVKMENLGSREGTKKQTYFLNQDTQRYFALYCIQKVNVIGSYLESSEQNYEVGQMESHLFFRALSLNLSLSYLAD